MKILLLSFYFPPDLSAGAFRAAALKKALLEEDDDLQLHIVTTEPNRYSALNPSSSEQEYAEGFSLHRIKLPGHKSGMLDQSRAFAVFAREALKVTKNQQWDLVIATSSRLMTAVLGALIARKTGAKLYLDLRDLFIDTMSDIWSSSVNRHILPIFKIIEKWTYRQADVINYVSPGFNNYGKSLVPEAIFYNYSNGIDSDFLEMDFSSDKTDDTEPPLIVYAGNMGEGQGLHHIIPQISEKTEGHFRMRLIGHGGKRAELERALEDLSCTNVEICDPVPRRELYWQYRDADILFLHLNDHAAFKRVLPSKIFEYGAIGKPILAGISGYAAEFVEQELPDAKVFAPCDAQGMLAALDQLSAEKELPKEREIFRQKFARESIMSSMAKDILAILD